MILKINSICWIATTIVVVLGTPGLAEEPATDPTSRYQPVAQEKIEDFGYQRYSTEDRFGREITFYLSKTESDQALPLVVCVQGSGSQSLFLKHQGRIVSGGPEAVVARYFRDRVRVLVVEKPGVEFLVQPQRIGSAEEGSEEYNREFSLERWVEAVHAGIQAARKLPGIDSSKTLVMGHSEGGQIACEVAAVDQEITHVACLAGGGPTQLHDLIEFARQGVMYDPSATAEQRVEALLADWQRVLDEPEATDKFILGHSHLRWSSFLQSSPVESILKSEAKVFVAQGMADKNSLPASADVLYAELLAHGRDCHYERIERGDHAFMTEGDDGAGWTSTNKKVVEWFLGDPA